jgi:hypothetical protein
MIEHLNNRIAELKIQKQQHEVLTGDSDNNKNSHIKIINNALKGVMELKCFVQNKYLDEIENI